MERKQKLLKTNHVNLTLSTLYYHRQWRADKQIKGLQNTYTLSGQPRTKVYYLEVQRKEAVPAT